MLVRGHMVALLSLLLASRVLLLSELFRIRHVPIVNLKTQQRQEVWLTLTLPDDRPLQPALKFATRPLPIPNRNLLMQQLASTQIQPRLQLQLQLRLRLERRRLQE